MNDKEETNTKKPCDDHDLASIFCLTIPQELRNKINFSEQEYRINSKNLLPTNSKNFYCYCLLDEIEKIGTNILRVQEIIHDEKDSLTNPSNDRIARNILQSIADEQNLWSRKLTELLIEIINFSKYSHELYFEHYLLTSRHFAYHKRINTYKDFYSCNRARDKRNQNLIEKRIQKIEQNPSFDITKAWYLKSKKSYAERSSKKISEHEEFRSLFRETLATSDAREKLVLGGSFENVSRLSRSLHPNIGGPIHTTNIKTIEVNIMHESLLSGSIELEIKKIYNLKPRKGYLAMLQKLLRDNPHSKHLLKSSLRPNIEKGDFVAVKNEIAEVKKVNINKQFGYKSFRVLFLERKHNDPCKEDEFLGSELILLSKRKKLIQDTKKIIHSTEPSAKLHGNSFTKNYRKYAVELWQMMRYKKIT